MEVRLERGQVIRLIQGDITKLPVDAIANAANSRLAGGGGVDGAIHRAGGPSIMAELDQIRARTGGCPTGGAVATGAGNLPAKFVFHAVGPVYRDGRHGEAEALASCYRTCLDMAAERKLERISFPSISTGAYGYPVNEAARVALRTVLDWLAASSSSVREVTFVLFDLGTLEAYRKALAELCSAQIE
jgi:O-acetyl-ADP-ribose deacetylase (regulator of RNase III)